MRFERGSKRAGHSGFAALAVLCFGLLFGGMPLSAAADNIVVIMVDDLGESAFDALIDGGWVPNIKSKIIDQGVRFDNSFVTNSLCCPSRATFLTGQYSHNHGVYSNIGNHPLKSGITWPGWFPANGQPGKNESTVSTWLNAAGYYTGLVGKYLNGYGAFAPDGVADPRTYVPPGWSEWFGLIDPSTYKVYDYSINQNGVVFDYGSGETDYQTDVLATLATGFLDRAVAGGDPFFLVVTPFAPHLEVIDPLSLLTGNDPRDGLELTIRPAPRHLHLVDDDDGNGELPGPVLGPAYNEADISDKPSCPRPPVGEEISVQFEPYCVAEASAYNQTTHVDNLARQYKSMLASMIAVDDLVGQIYARLEAAGKLEETSIIFTSDNGWLYGEHRMVGKELGYEESIRVPMVVNKPGGPQAVRSSKIVLNNDLAPTIAALAGVTPPYTTDGVSLLPLLADPENPGWHRRFFLVEHWFVPSLFKFETATFFAARRIYQGQNYVYIASHTDPSIPQTPTQREFYELNSDPYQLQSFTLPQSVNDILDQFLIYLRNCAGATCTALEGI